jgi:enoyl-CoA hydratase/carnithine racemase
MPADEPAEIDARYCAGADLSVCLTIAGGRDFCGGADLAQVFESRKAYCAGCRR